MHFREYWKALKPRLDEAFSQQLSWVLNRLSNADTEYLKNSLEGGKRLRGCLLCMVSQALGGSLEAAIPRATAIELIQTATLIHDDFVDQDTVRRNRPATWTILGARRAVLLGDVIFAAANRSMNELGREDGMAVSEAIARVALGAFHEPLNVDGLARDFRLGRMNAERYEDIIRLKTGALFGAACQLGAIAARTSRSNRDAFYRYGLRIGEAYQIADDMHELEQCMFTRYVQQDQMVTLIPALLYFMKERGPKILRALERGSFRLEDSVEEHLRGALKRMDDEMDRRLKMAVSEVNFPPTVHGELAARAPWEIVDMMLGRQGATSGR